MGLLKLLNRFYFALKKKNQPFLVLASGSNCVNEQLIQKIVGEKIVKADADFTRDITGFAIGGVPPIGYKQIIDFIFIDEALLHYNQLWAAAGTPYVVFSLEAKDLVK